MFRSTLDTPRDTTDLKSKCWSAMELQVISPPVLLIVVLLLASIGPMATTLSLMILLPVLLYVIQKYYSSRNLLNKTKFFLSWSTSSLIILILTFELQVVPYLEILFTENLVLILLTTSALVLVITIRKNECESRIYSHCDQSTYNHWIRSSISRRFVIIYVISQVLASMALLYGSQLTLTTICHSTLVFQTILIPDDCSEVYFEFDIRFCFVCAIYSIQISVCIILCLFRRLFGCLLNPNKPVVKYIKLNRIQT